MLPGKYPRKPALTTTVGETPRALSLLPQLDHLQLEYNFFDYRSSGATAALMYRCRRLNARGIN
eukprot:5568444-Prymnesium_polylepis.1